jgi:hypothetical protein
MRYFQNRYFLFLGYGLRDWNLRVVLRNLRLQMPGTPEGDDDDEEVTSWAIQFEPSDLEVQLWNARHVKIYDLMITEFVKQLRAAAPPARALTP